MKNVFIVALVLLASACSKPETPRPALEPVDALVANPERLKELRALCKAEHDKVGDAQCNAVAEATRQRFMGGGTQYTPTPAPTPPASAVSAPLARASS